MLGLFHRAAADTCSYVRDDRWVVLGIGTVDSAVPEGVGAAADTFSYVAHADRVVLGNGKTGSDVQEGVVRARLHVFRAPAVPSWFAETLVIGVGDRTITGQG